MINGVASKQIGMQRTEWSLSWWELGEITPTNPACSIMKAHIQESSASMSMNLVRRLIMEVINDSKYDILSEIVHEDYVYRSPDTELRGAAALEDLFEGYRSSFPDLHITIDDMFGDDRKVATAFTLNGTQSGPLEGIPSTGRRVSVSGIVHSRIKEGRIVEEWEMLDMSALMHQLTSEVTEPA